MPKVDPQEIRRLRDERAWSQEHLAAVTGLSLRTIQRVESDGNASLETRMALATAFEIDPARLRRPTVVTSEPPASLPHAGVPLPHATAQLPWLYYRLLRFVVVVGLFVGLDIYETGHVTWSRWVVVFGVAIYALRVVRRRFVEPAPSSRHRWSARNGPP